MRHYTRKHGNLPYYLYGFTTRAEYNNAKELYWKYFRKYQISPNAPKTPPLHFRHKEDWFRFSASMQERLTKMI